MNIQALKTDRHVERTRVQTVVGGERTLGELADMAKYYRVHLLAEVTPQGRADMAVLELGAGILQNITGLYDQQKHREEQWTEIVFVTRKQLSILRQQCSQQDLTGQYALARETRDLPEALTIELIPKEVLELLPHTGEARGIEILQEILTFRTQIAEVTKSIGHYSSLGSDTSHLLSLKKSLSKKRKSAHNTYRTYLETRPHFSSGENATTGHRMVSCTEILGLEDLSVKELSGFGPSQKNSLTTHT